MPSLVVSVSLGSRFLGALFGRSLCLCHLKNLFLLLLQKVVQVMFHGLLEHFSAVQFSVLPVVLVNCYVDGVFCLQTSYVGVPSFLEMSFCVCVCVFFSFLVCLCLLVAHVATQFFMRNPKTLDGLHFSRPKHEVNQSKAK